MLVLSQEDVRALLAPLSVQTLTTMMSETLATVYRDGQVAETRAQNQAPLRTSTTTPHHKMLYMPCRLGPSTSIKIVAVPTASSGLTGLPATTLVFDEATGAVKGCVNASELTAVRTAAASALATSLVADLRATRIAIFGTGAQASHHLRLISQLLPATTERTLSAHFFVRKESQRTADFLRTLQQEVPIKMTLGLYDPEILREADIVCTCTPSAEPLFSVDDLKPTVHINAIGSYTPAMQEFPAELIAGGSVLVDSAEACGAEAGEIRRADALGGCKMVELGELVATGKNFVSRSSRTVFKSVGTGFMDVAIAELMYKLGTEQGVGTTVAF